MIVRKPTLPCLLWHAKNDTQLIHESGNLVIRDQSTGDRAALPIQDCDQSKLAKQLQILASQLTKSK